MREGRKVQKGRTGEERRAFAAKHHRGAKRDAVRLAKVTRGAELSMALAAEYA